jgi:hypothetical protein
MKNADLRQIGEPLTSHDMMQIKGGVANCSNVFTTDTMTRNGASSYEFLSDAVSACWSDPGCVGIDVTSVCD